MPCASSGNNKARNVLNAGALRGTLKDPGIFGAITHFRFLHTLRIPKKKKKKKAFRGIIEGIKTKRGAKLATNKGIIRA